MAWIFGDSFDFYGATTDLLTGTWDSGTVAGAATLNLLSGANTRFGSGQCAQTGATTFTLTKASGSNDAGHHLVFAYKNTGTNNGNVLAITLYDGTLAQCSVCFNALTGAITLASGVPTGTVLATFAAGLSNGVWYGIEIEIVINNTTGSFRVRLNGNTADDFAATGLNTRAGSTNAYANKITLSSPTSNNNWVYLDDLLWFNTTGAAPNTWVGDVRAVQQMPISVASAGLAVSPASATQGSLGTAIGIGPASNTVLTSQLLTSTIAGSATGAAIQVAVNYTGKFKLAVYDGTSGSPGALLAQTAEQVNASVGLLGAIPFIAPTTMVIGQKYFLAILTDTAPFQINGFSTVARASVAQTYASGFPSSLGSPALASSYAIGGQLAMTPDNSYGVLQAALDGDTSFAYGTTAGLNDLYNLPVLPSTPLSIIAVQTRAAMRKSDSGLKQARIQVKSGATTSNGATVTLSASYTYQSKLDLVDPNTAAAWTASAVNSLQIGAYVVA